VRGSWERVLTSIQQSQSPTTKMMKKILKVRCSRDPPPQSPPTSLTAQRSSTPNSSTRTSSHSAPLSVHQEPLSRLSISHTQPGTPRRPSRLPSRPQQRWAPRTKDPSPSRPPRLPSPLKSWRTPCGRRRGAQPPSVPSLLWRCGVRTTGLLRAYWKVCKSWSRVSLWRTFSSWVGLFFGSWLADDAVY